MVIKTWGMASLPTGIFAINFSLHPTKTLEYLIPSDARSTILINGSSNHLDTASIMSGAFPNTLFNAEVMALTIKLYLSRQSTFERQSTIKQILEAESSSSIPKISGTASIETPVVKLRAAFQTPAMRKERLKRLLLMLGTSTEAEG